MPIIKDKYKAKSTRTTPIIQRNPKADLIERSSDGSSINLNTSQLQAIATQEARNNTNVIGTKIPATNSMSANILSGKIAGYNLTAPGTIQNLFTLNSGEKLNNIIINYQHISGTSSNINLFWSLYPVEEIENLRIKEDDTYDDRLYRIVSSTINSNTGLNLYELCQGFENIDKKIYFYGVASVADDLGVTFTFLVG